MSDEIAFHEYANIFPLIDGSDFSGLVASIRKNGVQYPIWLYDGKILDGRNRWRAAREAGVTCPTQEYKGDDPLGFVLLSNLERRHLDESQRAMVAARLANLKDGQRADLLAGASIEAPPITQDKAADMLNVSRSNVQRARIVQEEGTLELIAAVDRGEIAVSQAVKMAKAPEETQRAVVAKVQEGTKPTEASRQVRAAEIEVRQLAAPTGKYRVIYADPPWSYGNTQPDYHPEQRDHYPVMSITELRALPIVDLAEDDAVLFLWVTSPILEESFEVINAWGFRYKASFVWDKIKHNMGHYNSVRHEFLLVCTRGSCQPDVRKLFDSVIAEERRAHSEKPELFYEIINTIYPRGKRVELFARSERDGWDRWGYEANRAAA